MARKKYVTKSFTFEGKRYFARADSEAEALKKMLQLKISLEEGRVVLSGNMKLKDWWEQYVDTYKIGCKEITLKNYKYKMEKRLINELGHIPLKMIKPIHCQQVLNSMQGLSIDYIKKVKQGMYDIFEKAKDNKLIVENPCKGLVEPQGTKNTRRSITPKERKIILAAIDKDPRYLYFAIMLYCGLRPSEVALLQGMDVKDNLLHVRGTKSKNADRFVPIPAPLKKLLPTTVEPFDYLVTNKVGKKLTEYDRRNLWESFKRQLNITAGCKVYRNQLIPPFPIADDLVPYCLRHTYCTDLQKAGVDIRTAQTLMGHSSITITANIYTHTDELEINKAKTKLDEMYNDSPCVSIGVTHKL